MRHWRVAIFFVLAWVSIPSLLVRADELVIPYACTVAQGAVRLSHASATLYHIIGQREDLPFSNCAPEPSGACEIMMVHKFSVDCGGQKIAWSRIAAASRALGVVLPDNLPVGFAPIGRLSGRFVLPGFAARTPNVSHVAMQDLSPDTVVETNEAKPEPALAQWVTVVDADTKAAVSDGALKVASVVTLLIVSLMGACLLATRGRWPIDAFAFAGMPGGVFGLAGRAANRVKFAFGGFGSAFRRSYDSWQASTEPGGGNASVEHAFAIVQGRIEEADGLVLSLPADLILRDVLRSELDGLRDRAADIAMRVGRLGTERAVAMLKNLLRDLERIQRIVNGASPSAATTADDLQAPASIGDAYRVLGLNPDAPDSAVKKIVDALRLSWHPDHARSEPDRLDRERRIKQINAAWDMLKSVRAEAA